jgi:hypothetical protein
MNAEKADQEMAEISIEIRKSITVGGVGGEVQMYAMIPKHVTVLEAKRFAEIFIQAIGIAERWQENDEPEIET